MLWLVNLQPAQRKAPHVTEPPLDRAWEYPIGVAPVQPGMGTLTGPPV